MIYGVIAWYILGWYCAVHSWRKHSDLHIGDLPILAAFAVIGPFHYFIVWFDDAEILDKVIIKKATKK